MKCKKCGSEVEKGDKFCLNCGKPIEDSRVSMNSPNYTQNKYQNMNTKTPLGLSSFVLAIISFFLPVPYMDIGVGIAAIVFAIFALSKEVRRGFAIAGLVIGIISMLLAIGLLMENGYDDLFDQMTIVITRFFIV